jgi:hypothetical protein
MDTPISPNQFAEGSDSDRIEAAIAEALKTKVNSVCIPRINRQTGKRMWLIDRAILLPSDFTLLLDDCFLRLAPGVQDNLISNAGSRQTPIAGNANIRIVGSGSPVLSGGVSAHYERPGDKNGWPTIGILLYGVDHFTIEKLQMEETHAWAISMEQSAHGRLSNIDFQNTNKYPNQDGIDLRKGCHDIIIENITGVTGDDTIALTGLRSDKPIQGRESMQIGGRAPTEHDDIHNVIIRNVKTRVAGGHHIIRLLNQDGVKIYNIFITNVMDTSTSDQVRAKAAVKIGDRNYSSIRLNQLGETYNVFVDNVVSRAQNVVLIQGTLKNATFRNIIGFDGNSHLVQKGDMPTENVIVDTHQF